MRLTESPYAVCPFYKGHTHQEIHCEGAVVGCATHLAFAHPCLQRDHRNGYCEKFAYQKCPVARMLEAKYE